MSNSAAGNMPGEARRQGDMQPNPSVNNPIVPDDIPDGQDDDVVAGQIREAAMNEPDPVLREKLWEEYRQYKASIGGGQ